MSNGTNSWPKPWDEVVPSLDYAFHKPTWVDLGPLRGFNGTLYINADAGQETAENRDLWYPLETYLTEHGLGGEDEE